MNPSTKPPRRFPLFRVSRTLQVNILVAFALLLVITVLVIVGYTYRQNSTAVLNLSDDLINQVTETVLEKTNNYLSPAAIMVQASATIPAMDELALVDNAELEAYGMKVLDLYPQLSGFFIGSEQGDFLFTKRFAGSGIGTEVIDRSLTVPALTWTYRDVAGNVTEVKKTEDFDYDPRLRPWYVGAENGRHWTDIYIFFTDQKPGITAAYPIRNDDSKLVGVIGIDVALDELSRFLQTQKVGEKGLVFIVNDKGEIVAYPGAELATAEGDSFRPVSVAELQVAEVTVAYEIFRKVRESRFIIESKGERFIASFTPFPTAFGKDWQIGIVVPEADFIGTIQRTNLVSLFISLGILIVAIVLAIFISRTISRPIVQLTEETRKIKDFKLDDAIDVQSPIREVQQLGQALESMRTGLAAFEKYVPAALVRQLIKTGAEAQLGGDKKELTIFFTDIANFTSTSEEMPPEELMLQLSEYLGELATIVLDQQGTVDKYMGDGLMAFWGAPVPLPEHAFYACRAALQIHQKVDELNARWRLVGKPIFPTRIGIHTGETLVGNLGAPERMNYTVLGNSVNLASRLEAVNDLYGTAVLVSEATYKKVSDRFHFRPLDLVAVRGKREYVLIYELMGEVGQTAPEIEALSRSFTEGFAAYLGQNWEEALTIFEELLEKHPNDVVTQIYHTRCIALRDQPPGPGWQPLVNLQSRENATVWPHRDTPEGNSEDQ